MLRRTFLTLIPSAITLAAAAPALAQKRDGIPPLTIVVSLAGQRMVVLEGTNEIAGSPISSGKAGHATPTGIFSILQKNRHHRSNIYSNAPMPFMQRLTWSGIALHGGYVPGYPASHGCIRMPQEFARTLYGMTAMGAHVVVADDMPEARTVRHKNLPQPLTPAQRLVAAPFDLRLETLADGPVKVASAGGMAIASDAAPVVTAPDGLSGPTDAPLRLFITRRTGRERLRDVQRLLNILGFDAGPQDGYLGRRTIAALKQFQNDAGMPVTGVVSTDVTNRLHAATGRGAAPEAHLYARQGFAPVFDGPVGLTQPDEPMGTHFMTIAALKDGRADWWGMTLGSPVTDDVPPSTVLHTAALQDARSPVTRILDRIDIPAEMMARIAPLLSSGASLSFGDAGLGPETGKGTDFIVLT